VCVVINLIFQTLNYFRLPGNELGIIQAVITIVHLSLMWALIMRFKQTWSKYVHLSWFFSIAITLIAVSQESWKYHIVGKANESFLIITVIYLFCISFFTYCEFRLVLFVYIPAYIATTYITTIAQKNYYD
jgi:hypothetical protein